MSIFTTYKNQVELLLDVLPFIQEDSRFALIRKRLIKTIQDSLLPNEKDFLISIKSGEPQWDLMPIPTLSELPGIRWKVINIQKMDKDARLTALYKLKNILNR